MQVEIGTRTLRLERGDITKQSVDAIANAANSALAGGGGVDGAIHRAAGPQLIEELRQVREEHGECPPGSAVITKAYDLDARFVIHAVGPIWKGGRRNEDRVLAGAYRKSLQLATDNDVKTIAFPSISTGVYGYPLHLAAPVALGTVWAFLEKQDSPLEAVVFVLFDDTTFDAYQQALQLLSQQHSGQTPPKDG